MLSIPHGDAEYFAAPGLSASGMRDLEVSPYRYWFLHVNPNAPKEEPTPAMVFGSAVHCAVLEPDTFLDRYACEFTAPEGCLTTADTLKEFIRANGGTPKGTTKDGWIAQIQAIDSDVAIFDVLAQRYAAENAGKTVLRKADWGRVYQCAGALRQEPEMKRLLSAGRAEVPMFAHDPDTGVLLKAKMDWVAPEWTMDLKTFTCSRDGKSIDQTIADEIFYRRYFRQAYFYSLVRSLAEGKTESSAPQTAPPFILAFVEADDPHEVRIRELRSKVGGNANQYWIQARFEVRDLIRRYADCVAEYGDAPWRSAQRVSPLEDGEMRGLAFV